MGREGDIIRKVHKGEERNKISLEDPGVIFYTSPIHLFNMFNFVSLQYLDAKKESEWVS